MKTVWLLLISCIFVVGCQPKSGPEALRYENQSIYQLQKASDNAALKYWAAYHMLRLEKRSREWIWSWEEVELSDEVIEYLDKHRSVLDVIFKAAKLRECNWGNEYNLSDSSMKSSPISAFSTLFRFVLLATRHEAELGDRDKALDYLVVAGKMAQQYRQRGLLIDHLISIVDEELTIKQAAKLLHRFDRKQVLRLQRERGLLRPHADLIEVSKLDYHVTHMATLNLLKTSGDSFFEKQRMYGEFYVDNYGRYKTLTQKQWLEKLDESYEYWMRGVGYLALPYHERQAKVDVWLSEMKTLNNPFVYGSMVGRVIYANEKKIILADMLDVVIRFVLGEKHVLDNAIDPVTGKKYEIIRDTTGLTLRSIYELDGERVSLLFPEIGN